MGLTATDIHIMDSLRKSGAFEGFKSVIELGSQEIPPHHRELAHRILQPLSDEPLPPAENLTPRIAFQRLGFETHKSIDADGLHGAMVFDLNNDLRETYGFTEQFDLVTNMGTTEHVFNQGVVFKSIHNLCAVGGIMMHVVPFQGYLNHSFFNYHPLFFQDLVAANQYESIGLYVSYDINELKMYQYLDAMMARPPKYTMKDLKYTLCMIARKTHDREFQIPYQGNYQKTSKIADADAK